MVLIKRRRRRSAQLRRVENSPEKSWIVGFYRTFEDLSGGTIDGDCIAFFDTDGAYIEHLIRHIYFELLTAGDTGFTHASCNNGGMGSHASTAGDYTLGGDDAMDIVGAGLHPYKYDFLSLARQLLRLGWVKNHFTD